MADARLGSTSRALDAPKTKSRRMEVPPVGSGNRIQLSIPSQGVPGRAEADPESSLLLPRMGKASPLTVCQDLHTLDKSLLILTTLHPSSLATPSSPRTYQIIHTHSTTSNLSSQDIHNSHNRSSHLNNRSQGKVSNSISQTRMRTKMASFPRMLSRRKHRSLQSNTKRLLDRTASSWSQRMVMTRITKSHMPRDNGWRRWT